MTLSAYWEGTVVVDGVVGDDVVVVIVVVVVVVVGDVDSDDGSCLNRT